MGGRVWATDRPVRPTSRSARTGSQLTELPATSVAVSANWTVLPGSMRVAVAMMTLVAPGANGLTAVVALLANVITTRARPLPVSWSETWMYLRPWASVPVPLNVQRGAVVSTVDVGVDVGVKVGVLVGVPVEV